MNTTRAFVNNDNQMIHTYFFKLETYSYLPVTISPLVPYLKQH